MRRKAEDYEGQSKKRLLNNLTKKFNTTTIGSLSVFEDSFGFLWGHGIEYSELTKEERKWRKIWSDANNAPGSTIQMIIKEYLKWTEKVSLSFDLV